MMAERINPNDLELLSAYLDGQISPTQRVRLDSRLAQEPALQQALSDLRRTRQLLWMAPNAQRRRSFTLTPEMVKPLLRMQRAFSTMRMVSVLASVLFGVIVLGDAFTAGFRSGIIALAPASADMAEEQASDVGALEMESLAAADEADNSTAFDAPDMEEPAVGGGDDSDQRDAAAEGVQPSQVVGLSEGLLASTPSPQGTAAPGADRAALPSTTAGPSPTGTPPITSKVAEGGQTDLPDDQPAEEEPPMVAQMEADGEVDEATVERDRIVSLVSFTPLQALKSGLALVALVTGALALILRKRLR